MFKVVITYSMGRVKQYTCWAWETVMKMRHTMKIAGTFKYADVYVNDDTQKHIMTIGNPEYSLINSMIRDLSSRD